MAIVALLAVASITALPAQSPGPAKAVVRDTILAPASSQPIVATPPLPWSFIDAVGYGGLGFGVGFGLSFVVASDATIDALGTVVATIGVSTIAGIAGGTAIGRTAHRRVLDGRPVGSELQAAALAGAMLGGATLGALASIPLIEGEETGTPLGSDATTFGITTGVGALLGTLYATRYAATLPVGGITAVPTVAAHGRVGFRISAKF
jgi:hypothetical protein